MSFLRDFRDASPRTRVRPVAEDRIAPEQDRDVTKIHESDISEYPAQLSERYDEMVPTTGDELFQNYYSYEGVDENANEPPPSAPMTPEAQVQWYSPPASYSFTPVRQHFPWMKVAVGLAGLFLAAVIGGVLLSILAGAKQQAAPIPSLDSIVSVAPAPGYVIDHDPSQLNGYLSQSQIKQYVGNVPPSAKVYASTWVEPGTHNGVLEEAVLTPSVNDAQDYAAGFINTVTSNGAQTFILTDMSGSAAAATTAPSGSQPAKGYAVVARSRVAIVFIAAANDTATVKVLVAHAVHVTGNSIAIDAAPIG